MKSILVIGMGSVGKHLARRMSALKNEVMIVDRDEDIVEELAPEFADAQIGDCTNPVVLRALGINNFDVCFVTIGENFQSSLEITSLLKEMGAKTVVSKASSDIQSKFLLRNGADDVFYPEREIAEKLAVRYNQENIFNFIELSPDFSIFEIPVKPEWAGRTIVDIDVRKKYHINILAIKENDVLTPLPGAQYMFKASDHIIVLGRPGDVFRLSAKI
mgnify:CR=1 FL=1